MLVFNRLFLLLYFLPFAMIWGKEGVFVHSLHKARIWNINNLFKQKWLLRGIVPVTSWTTIFHLHERILPDQQLYVHINSRVQIHFRLIRLIVIYRHSLINSARTILTYLHTHKEIERQKRTLKSLNQREFKWRRVATFTYSSYLVWHLSPLYSYIWNLG